MDAAASLSGATVLEPSTWTAPDSFGTRRAGVPPLRDCFAAAGKRERSERDAGEYAPRKHVAVHLRMPLCRGVSGRKWPDVPNARSDR